MKNVLVLMHADVGQEARFQAALDITRALEGHLTCVDVSIVPAYVGDYADCGGTARLMSDEEARESDNRARFEARLKAEDVPWTWVDETGFLGPCVRDQVGLADLVVLNRKLDSIPWPDMRELVGEVLLKGHKPIVAVPETARRFDAFGHAMIAWDGSREADAALRAAVPLLQRASAVTIVEVNDGSIDIPGSEAAQYLSRHGISATLRRERADFDIPSTVLLIAIQTSGVAYLVMGGFGHSRFMESMLGGVSRRMLDECPVPVFLAH